MHRWRSRGRWLWLLLGLLVPATARADDDLADLSIEELLEVPVTTPSRAEEPLADAPATVVVITRHEIAARGYRADVSGAPSAALEVGDAPLQVVLESNQYAYLYSADAPAQQAARFR